MVGFVSGVIPPYGAPTDAGRAVLQSVAGDRPRSGSSEIVPRRYTKRHLATFTVPSATHRVELGDFTGSSLFVLDDHQGSLRLDHKFNERICFTSATDLIRKTRPEAVR
jgi:hypothetical protein